MRIRIISAWCGPMQPFAEAAKLNHERYAETHGYEYFLYDEIKNDLAEPGSSFAFRVGWAMPEMILDSFNSDADFVFWMDMDSFFTNMGKSLEDLTVLNKDLVFTGDHNDICNGGHLLFKNSNWSKNFLVKWQELSKIREPNLPTTHLSPSGQPGCQIALVALLGNFGANQSNFLNSFNQVNGWAGNTKRAIKRFRITHVPTTPRKLARVKRLVSPEIRSYVEIVEWRRLNSYHKSTKVSRRGIWRKGDPIVHLVAGSKDYFREFLNQ